MNRWLRVRSWLDRLVALVAGVVVAPVVGVLALLVRRRDGARALITVPRMGRDGRTFGMWKIRTMRADGPDGRSVGPALASGNDDRVGPFGRWLRATHLDELPQLYNVIRGDMAIVGPRPEAPQFVDPSEPGWATVLSTKPGMAGAAQLITGDWEVDAIDATSDGSTYVQKVVPVKLAIDSWYLRRASPLVDLNILIALVARLRGGLFRGGLFQMVAREVPEAKVPIEWQTTRRRTPAHPRGFQEVR